MRPVRRDSHSEPMNKTRVIRAPQQKRSIDKKENILDAAYRLFCEQGYHRTTAAQVAKEAGLSVGSFYAYFVDKRDLFLAVMDRYSERFAEIRRTSFRKITNVAIPARKALHAFMLALIEEHESSKSFNFEMRTLARVDPAIAKRLEAQERSIQSEVARALAADGRFHLRDPEATAIVISDLQSAAVDRIVFGSPMVSQKRIIEACLDAICAYLGI